VKRPLLATVGTVIFLLSTLPAGPAGAPVLAPIPGFLNSSAEAELENKFLAVPDPRRAEEHLRILSAAPHIAGSPEDRKTADYVAQQFRAAGLETEIVEYRVWINYPSDISVDVVAPAGVRMHGPSREHVDGDSAQDDPRVVTPYSGYSPSADLTADVVYANYGRLEDFNKLEQMKVDVHGKIVLVRHGANYRGVKSYIAQQRGAAAVILYSDPMDDGYFKGDVYPKGRWRPPSSVERGSIGYTFVFAGDATTPGVPSLPNMPASERTPPERSAALPRIPTTPLSWTDARPILEHLGGPESPRDWQGAMPFTYHLGPGPVRVHLRLKQDYAYRLIWNVIGRVRGSELPQEMVIAGNHRDSWVYGAVDPGSGTAAMLEAARGVGALLKSGWRSRRTIVFASWDGEEHGLIGSTEWVEQHAAELGNAVAYFNMDVGVSGPRFGASAVPSLEQFVRDITQAVPSPKGGTVYENWRAGGKAPAPAQSPPPQAPVPPADAKGEAAVGDLGSGSDYTPFLQHLGVPATDIGSSGGYPYHSVFDNFAWFKKFGDPDFLYEQQMARLFGLEILRMAGADALPFDYEAYGNVVAGYVEAAQKKADRTLGSKVVSFTPALDAARRLAHTGAAANVARARSADVPRLNAAFLAVERALLLPNGLPMRPWYRHAIYAPGRYTGYSALPLPGVSEAIDAGDLPRTNEQVKALAAALNHAAEVLESALPATP
jgi:N-acetylated-alpha-linked acidic dipeptidase